MSKNKTIQKNKSEKRKKGKTLKRILLSIVILFALAIAFIAITNIIVINSVKDRIISVQEAAELANGDNPPQAILVLGASVRQGRPAPILASRLDKAIELFDSGAAKYVLLSGDNGKIEYNEVLAMEEYMLEKGSGSNISDENIQLDHAGFSTYESMYRLRDVFEVDSAIIVTQEYHLYRALYSAKRLGIDVYGVAADAHSYGQFQRDVREILARTKDFCFVLFDVQPTYLGDPIPIGQE